MSEFVVGKTYRAVLFHFDPITVISRTKKTIRVTNGAPWTMRVRIDENGNEYARDSKSCRICGKRYLLENTYISTPEYELPNYY